MIKLAIVSNNYGECFDGVGHFAKTITSHFNKLECDVYTSNCNQEEPAINKLLNVGMTRCLFDVFKKANYYQAYLIEYPFVEWNPSILIPFCLLKNRIRKTNKKIIVSIHEYSRVNKFRKMVIAFLSREADLVFTSNTELKQELLKFNKNIIIRDIPSNIEKEIEAVNKKRNKFVYFGLINSTKAFTEMIEGWDKFNENHKFELDVISATKLNSEFEKKHKGVRYHYNLTDYEILDIMSTAMYCILPVKPQVDTKNATFKTASIAGCVCIGCFGKEFSNLSHIIKMDNYESISFTNAYCTAKSINDSKLDSMIKASQNFGKKYSSKSVAKIVEDCIVTLVEEVKK